MMLRWVWTRPLASFVDCEQWISQVQMVYDTWWPLGSQHDSQIPNPSTFSNIYESPTSVWVYEGTRIFVQNDEFRTRSFASGVNSAFTRYTILGL